MTILEMVRVALDKRTNRDNLIIRITRSQALLLFYEVEDLFSRPSVTHPDEIIEYVKNCTLFGHQIEVVPDVEVLDLTKEPWGA